MSEQRDVKARESTRTNYSNNEFPPSYESIFPGSVIEVDDVFEDENSRPFIPDRERSYEMRDLELDLVSRDQVDAAALDRRRRRKQQVCITTVGILIALIIFAFTMVVLAFVVDYKQNPNNNSTIIVDSSGHKHSKDTYFRTRKARSIHLTRLNLLADDISISGLYIYSPVHDKPHS